MEAQRQRIVAAMASCCAGRSFAKTKVSDVVALARVSRTTFYQLFGDKRGCFDRVVESCVERMREVASASSSADDTPQDAVRKATAALLDLLATERGMARVALVEAVSVDPGIVEHYRELVLPAIERRWRVAGEEPRGRTDPRIAFGRLQILIFDQLAAERFDELPALLPEVVYAVLLPFAGHDEALRQAGLAAKERNLPTGDAP